MPTTKTTVVGRDAADLASAKSGTLGKVGVGARSATEFPDGKKRASTVEPGLRSKRPQLAATAKHPAADDDEDVVGANL